MQVVGFCSAVRPQFLWGRDWRAAVLCSPLHINATAAAAASGKVKGAGSGSGPRGSGTSSSAQQPQLVLTVGLRSYTR